MMEFELTPEDARNLVMLLDTACKAGGLQAAVLAASLFAKLQAAAQEEREMPES